MPDLERAWPIFGRDGEGVAWRPDPATARASFLARFLASTGEPTLDALQARATADPAWFWGAATDDIGIPWTRRPREVLDASGGPAWARWWVGGAFDYAAAGLGARLDAVARRDRARLGGRGRGAAAPDQRRARGRGRGGRPAAARARDRRRRPRRDPAADAARDRDRDARPRPGSGPSSRRSSAATARRPSRPGSPTAMRRSSSPPTGSCGVVRGSRSRASPTRRSPRCRRCGTSSSSGGRAMRSTRRGRPVATSGGTSRSVAPARPTDAPPTRGDVDPETPFMLIYTSGTTGRPKGAVHVHGGFPIKAAQDLAHHFDLGPGDTPLLVHRPRLDDGPLGDRRVAPARRPARPLRGRAGLSRAGPPVVDRRASSGHPSRASRRPSSARSWPTARTPSGRTIARRCGSSARPASRGTRSRGGGTSARSARAAARSSTTRAGPRSPAGIVVGQRHRPDQAGLVLRAVHRDRGRRRRRDRGDRSAARSASSSSAPRCRA